MADKNNVFYNLSYTHEEIELLLRKIATGSVLQTADYDKLVNIIGIDNISTFSGNYNDLQNTPNIPYWTSDLQDDLGLATTDNVNQKLDAMYDRLVSLINEYENENEGIFANQNALDEQLQNLSWSLRNYVEQQIAQLPLSGYATKVALANKSDIGHIHRIHDIDDLPKELDHKSDIDHNHDLRYASRATEHVHTDLEALNTITQNKIDYWDEHVDTLSEDIAIINDKLDNELSSAGIAAQWDALHEIAHDNLEVLNGISDAKVDLWDGIEYLEFKPEKDLFVTTQGVGGLDKGTDISGFSIHMLLERILLPDIKPELKLIITNTPPGTIFETGTHTTVNKVTANIIPGSNPIKVVELFVDGISKESKTPPPGIEGSFNMEFIVEETLEDTVQAGYYSLRVTDEKQYSVSANSPAINFYAPCFYGIAEESVTIDSITADQIIAMTKHVGGKENKTFTYNTKNQRMVFAYPFSYGELTSILDLNGFEQIRAFEKVMINIKNSKGELVEYYVYMNNANTNSNFKMTYKF